MGVSFHDPSLETGTGEFSWKAQEMTLYSMAVMFNLSSRSAHKLITKIMWHTKKYVTFFCRFDKKKIGTVLIHSHWTAIVVLAIVIFLFDS